MNRSEYCPDCDRYYLHEVNDPVGPECPDCGHDNPPQGFLGRQRRQRNNTPAPRR